MPETNIDSADYGDFKNTITDWSITPQATDGAEDQQRPSTLTPIGQLTWVITKQFPN